MEAEGPHVSDAGYRPGYSVAAERIIDYIERHELASGERLPTEAEFADMLSVGRSVVRDALKTLAAVGRISTQRGRGIFVGAPLGQFVPKLRGDYRPTSFDDILAIFEFRAVQDRAGAELAAVHATPAELKAIEAALTDYAAQVAKPDVAQLRITDAAFHAAVNRASHNRFIAESAAAAMVAQGEVAATLFGSRRGELLEQSLREHTEIYDAISRGDAAAAAAAAGAHIDRTRRSYEAELSRKIFAFAN